MHWQKAISFGVKIELIRTFKVELKQKNKIFGIKCKTRPIFRREKEREVSFCYVSKIWLERKIERKLERKEKERKKEEEEKEGEREEEEIR